MEKSVAALLLKEALAKYGIKLKIVLETAIELAKTNRLRGESKYGDFDYRSLVEALKSKGFDYNPSQLLRILEREYGILVTSYHTSNQHWYKFKDLETVEAVLKGSIERGQVVDDPEIAMIKIQVRSLRPREMLRFLKRLAMKPRLSSRDVERFESFAFEKLPKIIRLLKAIEDYEDELVAEAHVLREVLELAYDIADRIGGMDLEIDMRMGTELEEPIARSL